MAKMPFRTTWMLLFLTVCLHGSSLSTTAQTITDWQLPKGWQVHFTDSNTAHTIFYDIPIQGNLTFTFDNGSEKQSVLYYVYLKEAYIQLPEHEVAGVVRNLPCIHTTGSLGFPNFFRDGYFYFLEPCHHCETDQSKACKTLAQFLFQKECEIVYGNTRNCKKQVRQMFRNKKKTLQSPSLPPK